MPCKEVDSGDGATREARSMRLIAPFRVRSITIFVFVSVDASESTLIAFVVRGLGGIRDVRLLMRVIFSGGSLHNCLSLRRVIDDRERCRLTHIGQTELAGRVGCNARAGGIRSGKHRRPRGFRGAFCNPKLLTRLT